MAAKIKSFLSRYQLPILSGIFIGTSYIPFPPWALLFCLTPLWMYFAKNQNWKSVVVGGWITQALLSLIGFHWIAHTAEEFGHFHWSVALGVLVLFCALAHLHYVFHGLMWLWLTKKLKLQLRFSLILLPICFLVVEEFWPFIFPWHLGYPLLYSGLPIYQLAEWVGFKGLNLMVLFLNLLILFAVLDWGARRWRPLIIALSVVLVGTITGHFLGRAHEKSPRATFKTLIVQANIGNLEKSQAYQGFEAFMESILESYAELTSEGLAAHPDTDLIVWPETAYPEYLNVSHMPLNRKFYEQLEAWQRPVLTGAYLRKGLPPKTYNSLALTHPDLRGIIASYDKTVLLAFGEYFPLADRFPILKVWFPFVADFGRGGGPALLPWGNVQLGAQICYEGLFHDFSAKLAQMGAHVLVNVTNDSWFGYPFEPYQHLYMTAARAVETRRPLIRSTNTGISTVVNANGQIQEIGPRGEKWYGIYEVSYPVSPQSTVYSLWAPYWRWVVLLIGIAVGIIVYVQNRKHGLGPHPR
jgi:apolipoprotein N-acyltransferase